MTIVITKGDNPGNYIYVDVNADFATLHLYLLPDCVWNIYTCFRWCSGTKFCGARWE
jgi:hypothetical protein